MKQKTRRFSTIILTSMFMIVLLFTMLWSNANAGFKGGGAGNCGDFATAIDIADDGDIIAQMTPIKDSSGVVITKNLRVSGSWFPTVNCATNNQEFATITDFLDYGFDYQAPFTRSVLSHNSSVLNIEDEGSPDFPQVEKLIIEHFTLQSSGTPLNGGGINGVISGTTELLLDNIFFDDNYVDDYGGGIKLAAWGNSHLIIEDSLFDFNEAEDFSGGGLFIELHDNAKLTIENSTFTNNAARGGGGFSVRLFDNSVLSINHSNFQNNRTRSTSDSAAGGWITMQGGHVSIQNTTFTGNNAGLHGGGLYLDMTGGEVEIFNSSFTGNQADNSNNSRGGGLHAKMNGGKLTIQDSTFSGNTTVGNTTSGQAGGLYVESVGSVDATLDLINVVFDNNLPNDHQFVTSGSGALNSTILDQTLFLPAILDNPDADYKSAKINSITLDSNFNYVVDFEVDNFVPNTSDVHVHFFFDTVSPENAGVPGSGPWKLYGGSSPFTGYNFTDRPFDPYGAEKLCILVANPDHSIRLGTGNCVKLP